MEQRVRYRTLLRHPEFRAVFGSQTLSLLGDQLARIALAILVYRRTGSPLESAATYAVSYLAYLVGGPLLSGLADRRPRLAVMVACDLVRAPLVLLLGLVSVPLWALLLLVALLGALGPAFDSARSALQPDILSGEEYLAGNALINVSAQVSQILGFVLGGAVVALTSVRGALALDAATFLLSAALLLSWVRHRPAAQTEPGAFLRDTGQGLALVARTAPLRMLLTFAVLGSVAVASTEGLAVAVADDLGRGPVVAGLLTATAPAGFLLGSVLVLRLPSPQRLRLLPLLVVLSAAPLLLTPLLGSVWPLAAAWTAAGAGATVNLIAGPAFVQACPRDFRGRAYGVASAVLVAAQGLALLLGGWLGSLITPRTAVGGVAAAVLVLALPVLRAQGTEQIGREVQERVRQGEGRT